MGASVSRAKQGTSTSGSTSGKLEFNPANETLLNNISKFIENYPISSPEAKLVFKSPLVWVSELEPSDFSSPYEQRGAELVSGDTISEKDDTHLLRLKPRHERYEMNVLTLEHCQTILKTAGSKKIGEVRACLEANNDPVSLVLGDRFADVEGRDTAAQRFMEEVLKEGEDAEEKKTTFRLLLEIQNLDKELLKDLIKHMSDEIRLSPDAVDREVLALQRFSGENEERTVLEYIDYVETFNQVYASGCRSPPWRQVHGDICYLEIKPHDKEDPFFVTASSLGYFINKGIETEGAQLDFERVGDLYHALVSLIKTQSPHFAQMIDKKEFAVRVEERDANVIDATGDLDAEDQGDITQRSEREQTKTQLLQSEKEIQKGAQKSKKDLKKKKLEPSLRWKNLGLEEEKEKEEEMKKSKAKMVSSGTSTRRRGKVNQSRYRTKTKTPVDVEESFSESSTESEEEEETPDRRNEPNSDLPSEYWQIQKLVKYLKAGNQTATIISLCAMRDFNLSQETCQLAIREVGGLEILINLLDTQETKCKIGALEILKEISRNSQIRRAIADLGGLQTMVKILLTENNDQLHCLAAETIANVAKFRRARRTVRQHSGIKCLVCLLKCENVNTVNMTPEIKRHIEVARCGALALWSCSKSTKNKHAMRKAGAIPLLAKLLKSQQEDMLIPVVGTLQECASEESYRLAIRTEGMIEDLVRNLKSTNTELQMHCASAIFKCAEEKMTRDLVREYGGLDPLVSLLNNRDNKELLAAATGAIWKCAISKENVKRFQELKAIDLLVQLLTDQPEEVLVNVVGALAECGNDPNNRMAIRKAGGIPPMVNLLTGTNQKLLVNVTRAVGQCAEESDNMAIIDRLDGVRLLWSLLKNQNTEVQASAAWAICPCIEHAKDAGEMVRSFVGGLELIVSLLKSEEKEVLASVCAAIANIAIDEENLAVITDHGVVPMLARLTDTMDDRLRQHLAEAIARCCSWGNNRIAFGQEKAVAALVQYLRSQDENVHRSTAKALYQLSKDPDNCITMHEAGVVKLLVDMVGALDEVLQEAAAGCIGNIRRLALANEKAKYA